MADYSIEDRKAGEIEIIVKKENCSIRMRADGKENVDGSIVLSLGGEYSGVLTSTGDANHLGTVTEGSDAYIKIPQEFAQKVKDRAEDLPKYTKW